MAVGSSQQRRQEGTPTSVVFVALGCTGEELGHGRAHRLGGAAQVLSTLLQLGQEKKKIITQTKSDLKPRRHNKQHRFDDVLLS